VYKQAVEHIILVAGTVHTFVYTNVMTTWWTRIIAYRGRNYWQF